MLSRILGFCYMLIIQTCASFSETNIGIIVGVAVGVLVLAIVLSFAIYLGRKCLRSWKPAKEHEQQSENQESGTELLMLIHQTIWMSSSALKCCFTWYI
jgi:membrane protein implicated in regulation of membrane protease activity